MQDGIVSILHGMQVAGEVTSGLHVLQEVREYEFVSSVTIESKVGDGVSSHAAIGALVTQMPDEDVVATATGQLVVARTTNDGVVALATGDGVVTGTAVENIITNTADKLIIAFVANQDNTVKVPRCIQYLARLGIEINNTILRITVTINGFETNVEW